jgi:hypothetical protein
VVDMAGDMRGCGPLDVGNGRMGFHVDNGMHGFFWFVFYLADMYATVASLFLEVLGSQRGPGEVRYLTCNQ